MVVWAFVGRPHLVVTIRVEGASSRILEVTICVEEDIVLVVEWLMTSPNADEDRRSV